MRLSNPIIVSLYTIQKTRSLCQGKLPEKELFDQDGIDNAMLPRSAGDAGTTNFSSDDRTTRKQVTPHVVRVCSVLLNRLDLYFPGLSGFCIAYGRIFAPKCPYLEITAVCTGYLSPICTNMGISRG